MHPEATPTIVAEALRTVADPWTTTLEVGPPAEAGRVAAAMARALAPEEADVPAPAWLRVSQRPSLRRAVFALRRFGGALLAEPVGTGKTYIALAVAAVWPGRGTVCFAPASLRDQWRATAERLGVPLVCWSNALVSLNRFPTGSYDMVIVDESHHYRNTTILRYRHLARWLQGRPTLLLTATPIVNRGADLVHQLHLTVRDDALRGAGIPSLLQVEDAGAHPALGQLVFPGSSRSERTAARPTARVRRLPATTAECELVENLGGRIRALALAPDRPIADLLRGVFWRALGSSVAAARGALGRYRHLLLQARDAQACQRRVSRRALRTFLAGSETQLHLWPLLPDLAGGLELITEDLPLVDHLTAHLDSLAGHDPKLDRLLPWTQDGEATLVFVNFVDTLHALRRIPGINVAWCTGTEAGIGPLRRTRTDVLAAFASEVPRAPHLLATTDVLAEGLDLQRARRVVHFDLPWTAVRLEQRNGRAVRSGSLHQEVEIVRLDPPPMIEAEVRTLALLAGKEEAARRMGLRGPARDGWRWRASLAEAFVDRPVAGAVARVAGRDDGLLIGLAIHGRVRRSHGNGSDSGVRYTTLVWIDAAGRWTEGPGLVSVRLFEAAAAAVAPAPCRREVDAALESAAPAVRALLARWSAGRWTATPRPPEVRRLVCRLRGLAVRAARARDPAVLGAVDAALAFAAGGHTAGERQVVAELAAAPDGELHRRLGRIAGPDGRIERAQVTVTGLILFAREERR